MVIILIDKDRLSSKFYMANLCSSDFYVYNKMMSKFEIYEVAVCTEAIILKWAILSLVRFEISYFLNEFENITLKIIQNKVSWNIQNCMPVVQNFAITNWQQLGREK